MSFDQYIKIYEHVFIKLISNQIFKYDFPKYFFPLHINYLTFLSHIRIKKDIGFNTTIILIIIGIIHAIYISKHLITFMIHVKVT